MAYSWSIAGGVVTLTLDGTGGGAVSRSRTFTGLEANERYTFYLTVDPDVMAIGAFLEVEGGDTAVADVVGSQTLRARGVTDGSGEITVRFGAQTIEAAPSSEGADDLDYADDAAAALADWGATGAAGFGVAHSVNGISPVAAITGEGAISKTFALTPGGTYTFRVFVESSRDQWFVNCQIFATSGATTIEGSGAAGGAEGPQECAVSITADGSGEVTLSLSQGNFFSFFNTFWIAGLTIEGAGGGAEIDFSDLTYCLGSGVSETGGTGLGPDADDEIPTPPPGGYPPPPTGGARPFGAFEVPPEGLGYWNTTVKQMSVDWIANLVNKARTAGGHLFLAGRWRRWLNSSGMFSYDLWKQDMDELRDDARANDILDEAIADQTAFAHYVIDEPFHGTRYGGPISFTTVERMCMYSKTLWPTWPTTIRVPPTHVAITRHMNGLDWLWAQYTTRRGAVADYLSDNIARAAELEHGLVVGVNIADFLGTETRPVTPDELRNYGGILASSDVPVAFMSWRYEAEMYNQTGFPGAVQYVRDLFASFDP